ncbi:MAG TPA: DUF3106 domain-containing protein [Candidatus Acidoferrum sp.]|jgi:hypothetical protein|nr:DUF3106 domain-containing protein [Candidatus Acidoferrum sp.]
MSTVRKFGEWRCRPGLCGRLVSTLVLGLALATMLMLPVTAQVDAAQRHGQGPKSGAQGMPRQNTRNDRPPRSDGGGAQTIPRPNTNTETNLNRPPSSRPPNTQDRWRNMSPADRQRVLQNERRLQSMSPSQQQVLRDRAQVWNRMTPEQRDHVRNDVLPQWRQMPPDRKQAIRNRLRVLQNMPESARNQRLNDPRFTQGMSEEDKSTLRDLSHLHVGGAPE